MKTLIRTLLATSLALGLNVQTARAGDDALAALGGFVAGVITGAVIEHNDGFHGGVSVSIGNAPCYSRCGPHGRLDCGACFVPGPHGYWEVRQIRIWVPGYWDFVINHCGDRVRIWRAGHYEYRPHRVWVARHYSGRPDYRGHGWDRYDRHDRREYGRHDTDRRDRRGHPDRGQSPDRGNDRNRPHPG